VGKALGGRRVSNDPGGHRRLHSWIASFGERRVVGIECSGTFGAALARQPLAAGEDVREVPGNLSCAEANLGSRGKSDPTDALAIARVVLREPALPAAGNGTNEDLKLLSDHRDRLIKARTAELSHIHAFMTVLRPGYQTSLGILKKEKGLSTITRSLRGDRSVRADIVREAIVEVRRLNRAIKRVEGQIAGALERTATLHNAVGDWRDARGQHPGRGPGSVAAAVGRGIRKDEWCGTHPRVVRQHGPTSTRPQRNRTLNRAIHMVAVVRCRLDEPTKLYMAKKHREGKTGKEAMRSLKRHIANDIYRRMKADCGDLLRAA
jgi:transposase